MKTCCRWSTCRIAFLGVALLFSSGEHALADTPSAVAVRQPDLTSPQLDWEPQSQFAWPDKAWNLDPWWNTATLLTSVKLGEGMKYEPENIAIVKSEDSWNRRLLKALTPKVTQLSDTTAYIAEANGARVDLSMAKFQATLPFEIRQSIWVWTFWFPRETPGGSPTIEGVRATLPETLRSKFILVTEAGFPKSTLRLEGDALPPYLKDMLLFETEHGVILCGSKIMGGIAMRPDHRQTYWFTRPMQRQQQQQQGR